MTATSVTPAEPFYDLSMDGKSAACADVRRALNVLTAGGGGDAQPAATRQQLDAQTERQLEPFASMFQFERLQTPYRLGHVLLLLYAPLGLLLLLLRGLLLFLAALVLPSLLSEAQMDRLGVHTLFAVLTGTVVRVEDAQRLRQGEDGRAADIVVANHISEFDALALLRGLGAGHVLGYDFYEKMLFFRLLRGKSGLVFVPYASRNQGGGDGRDRVREIILDKLATRAKPLMAFPEARGRAVALRALPGGLTNGRKGLLQYHKFLFSLGKSIQPLAIQATDGPFPVNINDETSTFAANVGWYLFVPWHVYTIKCLPRTEMLAGEEPLDVAQRVMRATADTLRQQATPFLYRDKTAFTRYKAQQLRRRRK